MGEFDIRRTTAFSRRGKSVERSFQSGESHEPWPNSGHHGGDGGDCRTDLVAHPMSTNEIQVARRSRLSWLIWGIVIAVMIGALTGLSTAGKIPLDQHPHTIQPSGQVSP